MNKKQKEYLRLLKFNYQQFKYKFNSSTKNRFLSKMYEAFGLRYEGEDRIIEEKDIDLFYEKLKDEKKDKEQDNIKEANEEIEGRRDKEVHAKIHTESPATIRRSLWRLNNEKEKELEYLLAGRTKDFQFSLCEEEKEETTYIEKYPDQKASLMVKYCNQVKAAKTLWKNIESGKRGQLLLAQTGSGKTFILGSIVKNLIEQGYIKKLGCISPMPILWVTKASVVDQTKNVLSELFNIDCVNTVHVINIEWLRAYLGKMYVQERLAIKNGQEYYEYTWTPYMNPCIFVWDECQILARESSQQSKIAYAASKLENIIQIDASATPFARVSEGKQFALASGRSFKYGFQEVKITEESWSNFAKMIASPSDPDEYCTEAVKRFIDFFDDEIVRIAGIRPKFKSKIGIIKLRFRTEQEREDYDKAYDEFQAKKAKLESSESIAGNVNMFILAEFTIFRKKAELLQAPYLADFIIQQWNAGFAPVIGCSFKATITEIVRILIQEHDWTRDDISLIWGGSTESLNDKQKLAKKVDEKRSELDELLSGLGVTMEQLGFSKDTIKLKQKTEEQYIFEKINNLLSQKPEDREREKLRFQRQDSRCLLMTYKSGGVGLSCHHEAIDNECKVARYPKARPRRGRFTVVYSEKEMIQFVGRPHRINSVSPTELWMSYFGGTIEDHVARRVVTKLKCMKVVCRAPESWEDIITGGKKKIEDVNEEEENGEDISMLNEVADDIDNALTLSV